MNLELEKKIWDRWFKRFYGCTEPESGLKGVTFEKEFCPVSIRERVCLASENYYSWLYGPKREWSCAAESPEGLRRS